MAAERDVPISVEEYLRTPYIPERIKGEDSSLPHEHRHLGNAPLRSRMFRVQFRGPHIWMVDPFDRAGHTYSAAGFKVCEDGLLKAPEIPDTINLSERLAAIYE